MGIDAEVDTSQGGDIIQTLKDEIFCSICCAIFEDPLKLDCCDGHLCKVCFEDVKGKFPSCPLCRGLNFTAKPSRLMVSVLSTITLNCPAAECNEKFNYSQFKKHKETCIHLNMKTCERCNVKMELPEFERHSACFQSLLKNFEEISKKNEITKKNYSDLTAKHRKTLGEKKEATAKIDALNSSLNKNQEIIRQLQLSVDQKEAQLHQLQYHNHMGGAQNHGLATENEKLRKSLHNLNVKMEKTVRDHQASTYKLNEENRMLKNSVNEKSVLQIKLEEEAKRLRQSNEALKKNATQAGKKVDEKQKKAQNKLNTELQTMKKDFQTLQSNYDHLSDLFCQDVDTENCKSCKSNIVSNFLPAKQAQKEKTLNDKIKKLETTVTNLNRTVSQQKEQHKEARKTLEDRIKQQYEAKVTALERNLEEALKNTVDPQIPLDPTVENLAKIKTEKKVLQKEILELQKRVKSFEKEQEYLKEPIIPKFIELERSHKQLVELQKSDKIKLFEANQRIEELEASIKVDEKPVEQKSNTRDTLSQTDWVKASHVTKDQAKILELQNEIARLEQSNKLYFQMYEKERLINQERAGEKQGLFGLFKRK